MEEKRSIQEIDKDRLDEEWQNHPKLMEKYAVRLADARENFADLKAELEVIKAEVAKRVRSNPIRFGILKISNDAIGEAVTLHPKVKNAVKELNRAKHKVDVLEAVCNALEHRKKALENLVTLFLQHYWSEPRMRSPKVDEKARSDRIARKMAKRRKNE